MPELSLDDDQEEQENLLKERTNLPGLMGAGSAKNASEKLHLR